jgi:hypothetical protein
MNIGNFFTQILGAIKEQEFRLAQLHNAARFSVRNIG